MKTKTYHGPNDDSVIWASLLAPEKLAGTSISLLRRGRGVGWAAYVVVVKSRGLTWLESQYRHTRNTVEKGMVLPGYGNPEPIPVPKRTRDHIITVLPVPVDRVTLSS